MFLCGLIFFTINKVFGTRMKRIKRIDADFYFSWWRYLKHRPVCRQAGKKN